MYNGKKVKFCVAFGFLLAVCGNLYAQNITTASAYFKTVSDFYGTLKTYEADLEINADKQEMAGHASFKRPDLLRIDFTNPPDQVITFNGDMLTIYLPTAPAVLQQSIQSDNDNGASLATPQGLSLMSRYYTVAYEIGQDPVALDETSDEQVIKLVLTRKNTSEGFRAIKLAVSASTNLIRRMEATTPRGEVFTFNFLNYSLNHDISDQRFIYDPPSSANNYNNFLFTE